jgi:6-pyruvoyl-tetrahydropterin synthase
VLARFDHRNINAEIAAFQSVVPTSENLGCEIYRSLAANWKTVFPSAWPVLEKIRIAETERNIFEVNNEK